MIDYLALALTHALLALAAWRMLQRADLDREEPEAAPDAAEPPAGPAPRKGQLRITPRA